MRTTVDWMSFWLQSREDPTTLNDQLCSRPDVLAAKGPDLSAHVDAGFSVHERRRFAATSARHHAAE